MSEALARKKKESPETAGDAPVRVTPVVPAAPPNPSSLDVVRCPRCNFLIPAKDVRQSLHATGTATCPKCQNDLADAIGGTNVD